MNNNDIVFFNWFLATASFGLLFLGFAIIYAADKKKSR